MNYNVVSPIKENELLRFIDEFQDKKFRFGAGGTDLLLELKHNDDDNLTVINLGRLDEAHYKSIEESEGELYIGALTTAREIVDNDMIRERFPVLYQAANTLASKQIRQVATVGGNICTASPAGDIATALVALKADCELLSSDGSVRIVPLSEFLIGVRKTVMTKKEVLRRIKIKMDGRGYKLFSKFIKIGTRMSMECSVVSLAYHIKTDDDYTVMEANVAIGSSAPTIQYAQSACAFLKGKNLNFIETEVAEEFANKVMEYADPISDVRGSAWYRKKVLSNVSKSIFDSL